MRCVSRLVRASALVRGESDSLSLLREQKGVTRGAGQHRHGRVEAPAPRPGARRAARASLQPANRRCLRCVDQALYLLPRQATPHDELTRFLTSLAVDGRVAASTQNQALSALLFLYR